MSESSWNTAEKPAACAALGLAARKGCAAEEDAALVGPDRAGEDLDEGAFSGAVLADQRVDLAGLGVELGARQGGDAAVALRNCRGFEQAHVGLRKEKRRPGNDTPPGRRGRVPSLYEPAASSAVISTQVGVIGSVSPGGRSGKAFLPTSIFWKTASG